MVYTTKEWIDKRLVSQTPVKPIINTADRTYVNVGAVDVYQKRMILVLGILFVIQKYARILAREPGWALWLYYVPGVVMGVSIIWSCWWVYRNDPHDLIKFEYRMDTLIVMMSMYTIGMSNDNPWDLIASYVISIMYFIARVWRVRPGVTCIDDMERNNARINDINGSRSDITRT